MSTLSWRPGGSRYVAYGVAVVLLVLTAVISTSLPEEITFVLAEKVTFLLFLFATLFMLHGVGRSRVTADETGMHVTNGYKRHDVAWDDIEGFSLNTGAPWPTLVTTDDDRVMLFAIQSSDGPSARAAVGSLQQLLQRYRVDQFRRQLDAEDET